MVAGERQQILDQALKVSQRMADLGAQGDWEQVIALEQQRSGLLRQAFAGHQAPADDSLAQQIRAIMETDKRLMNMGVEARAEAASELAQLQRGRKGQQAYQAAGR